MSAVLQQRLVRRNRAGQVDMGDLEKLFDSSYSKFALRDFFGKVVPGLVLLAALTVAFSPTDATVSRLASFGLVGAFAVLGLSWVAGLMAQSIGESLKMIRYYPKVDDAKKELTERVWYKTRIEVERTVPDQNPKLERLP